MNYPGELLDHHLWRIERRGDGALLVRVSSQGRLGDLLPDAVFAFRSGDPQYGYWEARLHESGGKMTESYRDDEENLIHPPIST